MADPLPAYLYIAKVDINRDEFGKFQHPLIDKFENSTTKPCYWYIRVRVISELIPRRSSVRCVCIDTAIEFDVHPSDLLPLKAFDYLVPSKAINVCTPTFVFDSLAVHTDAHPLEQDGARKLNGCVSGESMNTYRYHDRPKVPYDHVHLTLQEMLKDRFVYFNIRGHK